ncbi:bifunctional UDP-4-keto-pentose/UDP-xylose synthase [Pectinatus haikarae]|uniref:Nucleoside-diphosphate-sugar epimerase n=1 Tax=Pectinatus haikarae TaxID=349096 RepID=A0ABT9Y7F6_9FIRM|nr:bifunctional UDP-4-keto-pentose/UDP-xylose synthase [Pectinatus haikarae]MDQ0203563.1 nucleoside-diphosphate-sugar epimerase [Pectinatus haikarae]
MKIFITGINGFIGTHLLRDILQKTDWQIQGFDLHNNNLGEFAGNPRFSMKTGDIFEEESWLEQAVKENDVILPLAGIARPAYYITHPLWTFELDFEQNLKIVRHCAKYKKRVIFPSTSEVYGMPTENSKVMIEDESTLTLGPIKKSRWIYSCSKQMMDRVIFAFGQEKNLPFSIFRPFNWVGPGLDTFKDAAEHKARSITQFIYDILYTGKINLVGGGAQKRSFIWVGDGIDGLIAIIKNEDNKANGEIFNLGNPANHYSIKELALMIIEEMKNYPQFAAKARSVELVDIPAAQYYGKNYDDMQDRLPSIQKMKDLLCWEPKTSLREAIKFTLDWHAAQLEKGL